MSTPRASSGAPARVSRAPAATPPGWVRGGVAIRMPARAGAIPAQAGAMYRLPAAGRQK